MYIQKSIETNQWVICDCFWLNWVTINEVSGEMKITWNLSLYLNTEARDSWKSLIDNFTFKYSVPNEAMASWNPILAIYQRIMLSELVDETDSEGNVIQKETNLLSWNLGTIGLQDWILIA